MDYTFILLTITIILSFPLLSRTQIFRFSTVNVFPCWHTYGLFRVWDSINKTATNTYVQALVWAYNFDLDGEYQEWGCWVTCAWRKLKFYHSKHCACWRLILSWLLRKKRLREHFGSHPSLHKSFKWKGSLQEGEQDVHLRLFWIEWMSGSKQGPGAGPAPVSHGGSIKTVSCQLFTPYS